MDEIKSIEQNDTWYLTDLASDHRAIEVKWVFKEKRDEHGAVTKNKVRLVAKVYAQ